MRSPISNDSTSTFPLEITSKLNPVLTGLVPYTAMDPAGGKEMMVRGDWCALVTGFVGYSQFETSLYVVEARGGPWKSSVQVDELFECAMKWRPRQIFIEDNVGKGWLQETINAHGRSLRTHLPIIWCSASLHGTGKKTERIQGLQTPYKYHRIWHANELKGSEFERQVLLWTPEGKMLDDFADALALLWFGVNRKGIGRGSIRVASKPIQPIYESTQV